MHSTVTCFLPCMAMPLQVAHLSCLRLKACHIEELLKADEFVQFTVEFLNTAVLIFIQTVLEVMVLFQQLVGEAFHQFVLCVCVW